MGRKEYVQWLKKEAFLSVEKDRKYLQRVSYMSFSLSEKCLSSENLSRTSEVY